MEPSYAYKMFSVERMPSRDRLLLLAFGFPLNYRDTALMLESAGKTPLRPAIKRDAIIIFSLEHSLAVEQMQGILERYSKREIGGKGNRDE
ncbi:MAG: hypothetical protein LBU32_27935 [Clostridiales bacterium]|nr:hypothetical protein [Clostridiales bacterium]